MMTLKSIQCIKNYTILVLLIFTVTNLSSQTNWVKYHANPVKGGAQPSCLLENDTIKMWYASGYMGVARIFAGWSLDGIIWNDYNGANPVLPLGSTSEWDNTWHDTPEILKANNMYYLFYYGDSTTRNLFSIGTYDSITCAIGLATSADGINWIKNINNPVLSKGDSLSFDGRWIESPTVIYDNDQFYMWYSAMPWSLISSTGLAISDNASDWQKYIGNPVVAGGSDFYDSVGVYVPCVIKSGEVFEMWYSAMPPVQNSWDSISIAYAVSIDGKHWIKFPGNPVYDRFYPPFNSASDNTSTWAPEVVFISDSNKYFMYYDGSNGINLAISDRNILYSSSCLTSISNDTTLTQGSSVNLSATGGTYFQWYPSLGLNNPNIANPIATPDTTTQYKVLIVSDSCITVDSVLITVLPTSVNEQYQIEQNFVNIYPNPFSETTTIEIKKWNNQKYIFIIFDLFGREILKYDLQNQKTEISRKELLNGMYYYQVRNSDSIVSSGKFILQ